MKDVNILVERKNNDFAEVHISGKLSVHYSQHIYHEIKKIAASYSHLVIKLIDIEEFDLAIFQIFYALKLQYESENKKVEFISKLNSELQVIFTNAGLENLDTILSIN